VKDDKPAPFEQLRLSYEQMDAATLRKQANDLIGISKKLGNAERRNAVRDWFTSYDVIRHQKIRGLPEEFMGKS